MLQGSLTKLKVQDEPIIMEMQEKINNMEIIIRELNSDSESDSLKKDLASPKKRRAKETQRILSRLKKLETKVAMGDVGIKKQGTIQPRISTIKEKIN